MNYKFFFFLFLSYSPFYVEAQNLVPNGSFEEVVNCPSTNGALHYDCANWFQSIQVPGVEMHLNPSPDWFHTCSTYDPLTPPTVSFGGYQEPFEGGAYSGIITYASSNPNYREIIGVALLEPMEINTTYSVSLRITKGTGLSHSLASSHFGIKFSNQDVFEANEDVVNNEAHFYVDSVITDTLNWQLIDFTFIPEQAYTYMHIGNFFEDEYTEVQSGGLEFEVKAYYLIDDVVVEANPLGVSDTSPLAFTLFPNPCGNYLDISSHLQLTRYEILDMNGRILKKDRLQSAERIDLTTLKEGIYIIKLQDEKENYYHQTFIKQ